jgi:cell division ATPase FtsA
LKKLKTLKFKDKYEKMLTSAIPKKLNHLKSAKISLEIISNIVLIGGVSQTLGIDKLAKQIYQKNTRIGYPIKPNNIPADFNNVINTTILGMLTAMQNEFIKYQGITPENNENWLKKILNKFIKD